MSNTFTYTLPIKTQKFERDILNKRFGVARMFYNRMLSEAFKLRKRLISNENYVHGIALHKQQTKESLKEAKKFFSQAKKEVGFSEYSFHKVATRIKNETFFKDHLGGEVPQTIATTVFKAVESYHYKEIKRPRFKGKNRLKSISGKSINSGMLFKDGKLLLRNCRTVNKKRVTHTFDLIYDKKDKDGVESHALSSKLKYSRLLKKFQGGEERYYLQLVLEGEPLIKKRHQEQRKYEPSSSPIVGLDFGPSVIAAVSDTKSDIRQFNSKLKNYKKEQIRLHKELSRSLRETNPEAFRKDKWVKKDKRWKRKKGTSIRGVRLKNRSKKTKEIEKKLKILYAKNKATREQSQGELINFLLTLGNRFHTEKVSIRGWQKLWGRSILNQAPRETMEKLSRKAENAGGYVYEFPTYTTKLSQTCICGQIKKKTLNDRWHKCECGVIAQRDLFSAYLSRYVVNDELDILKAEQDFCGVENLLKIAISDTPKSSNSRLMFRGLEFALRDREDGNTISTRTSSV